MIYADSSEHTCAGSPGSSANARTFMLHVHASERCFFFFFIRHCSVLIFVIPPFVCFIRPLLPAPFFMSVPVRYCLEEKCREANAIVGLPLGSPEAINTTEENEMFFLWTITHTLFTVWLKSRRAHFSNKSRLA